MSLADHPIEAENIIFNANHSVDDIRKILTNSYYVMFSSSL